MACIHRICSLLIIATVCTASYAQQPTSTQPTDNTSAPPAPDEIAVTVNGHPFTEYDVDVMIQRRVPRRDDMTEGQWQHLKRAFRDKAIEDLVNEYLLDQEVEKAGIEVTDADMKEWVTEELNRFLANSGMTRDELDAYMRRNQGKSLDNFLVDRAKDPSRRRTYAHLKFIEKKFPEVTKVTDEEILAYYEKHRDRKYTTEPKVRASHILIGRGATTPEEKKAARKTAEELLKKIRTTDADFAALAREHSECPSKAEGGDLGFFKRQGDMVEAFAATAFALDTGEVSDIVETSFGYHIIKVTEKKKGGTIPVSEARPGIEFFLRDRHLREKMDEYATKLHEQADVAYPPGKEPKQPDDDAPRVIQLPQPEAGSGNNPASDKKSE